MLKGKVGFKEARRRLIKALHQGTFLHEARSQIDTKICFRWDRLRPTACVRS